MQHKRKLYIYLLSNRFGQLDCRYIRVEYTRLYLSCLFVLRLPHDKLHWSILRWQFYIYIQKVLRKFVTPPLLLFTLPHLPHRPWVYVCLLRPFANWVCIIRPQAKLQQQQLPLFLLSISSTYFFFNSPLPNYHTPLTFYSLQLNALFCHLHSHWPWKFAWHSKCSFRFRATFRFVLGSLFVFLLLLSLSSPDV